MNKMLVNRVCCGDPLRFAGLTIKLNGTTVNVSTLSPPQRLLASAVTTRLGGLEQQADHVLTIIPGKGENGADLVHLHTSMNGITHASQPLKIDDSPAQSYGQPPSTMPNDVAQRLVGDVKRGLISARDKLRALDLSV